MIRFLTVVVATAILAIPAARAKPRSDSGPFPVPTAAQVEEGTLRCLDEKTGKVRWSSRWRSEFAEQGGVKILRSREEAHGIYGKKDHRLEWWNEAVWKAAESWLPVEATWEFRDADGELVERIGKTFQYPDGEDSPVTVRIDIRRSGGKTDRTEEMEIPAGTLGTEGLAFPFRTLGFTPDLSTRFHLVTNEPKLYRMKLIYLGEETVTVPAGTFLCHKIRLVADFGFWNFLVRPFIPDTFFWHTVAEPHIWVKYQGLESSPGSPRVILELVSFQPAAWLR